MRRPLIAVALLALVAVALAVFAGSDHRNAAAHTRYRKNDPDARPAATGSTGLGSPDSALSQEIAALAYPSNSLKESLFANAQNFYGQHIKGRAKKHSKGWQLVGPTDGHAACRPERLRLPGLRFRGVRPRDRDRGRSDLRSQQLPRVDGRRRRRHLAERQRTRRQLQWKFLSDSFGTNAIGTLVYDAKSNTLYAGTGEPNASGDSEAGVGIYASHDDGNRWTLLPGSPAAMNARSISSIVVDPLHPGTLYVGTARGVRGVSVGDRRLGLARS